MSSTIFTATSGTSISVDPHADVEGAGQQNPAVPHDAQNGAPAPGNPPNEDLLQAEARLRQMLDTALDRSGGLRGIGGDLYDAIKTEIPRPKVFHGGFRIHSAMLKAANACDVAAANLRVAESWVQQFGALAKTGATMIIPQDLANLSGIVAGLTSVIRHDGGSSVQTSSAGARKEAAENGNGGAPVNVGGFNFTPPRV